MPRRPAQATFFNHRAFEHYNRREHGGTIGHGRRKRERPLDPRKPLHVVLRSETAKGPQSLLHSKNERRVKHLVYETARKQGVRVFRYANAGNHLHIVVQAKHRRSYQNFLRAVTGLIARAVTGAQKGVKKGKFWQSLAYSRVVNWGRELKNVKFYLIMNELEGLGIWSRQWHVPRRGPRPDT